MARKILTAVRLTEDARILLAYLARQHGLSHTAIVELAIREKAQREQIALRRSITLHTPTAYELVAVP